MLFFYKWGRAIRTILIVLCLAIMLPVGVMAYEGNENDNDYSIDNGIENGDEYLNDNDIENDYLIDNVIERPITPPPIITPPLTLPGAEPARDISINYIPTIHSPATTIIFVGAPADAGPQIYTIMASSPITGVERMLLEDNRLVIDIINSTTALTGELPVPPFLAVNSMRVSQFNDTTTRVVFEMEAGTEFSIDISPDRTMVFLSIRQHSLFGYSFEAEEWYDIIVLHGVSPPAVQAQPGQGRLRFFLSNTQTEIVEDMEVEGGFVNNLAISQWTAHTALLDLAVREFTAHSMWQSGPNETTIRLHPATYRNIHYSFEERAFRIPKTEYFQMDISMIFRIDLYHNRQLTLHLPIDASEHIGFGEMLIADSFLQSVSIFHAGTTQLIFNGNQIFTLDLREDDDYYIIRVLHPRERYSRIVVLDPGHGGRDPGAVRGGVREADLNLAVTRKLLQLIESDGFIRAYTTRNADVHLGEYQVADLRARANFSNALGDLFISIHFNASRNTAAHGVETYYRPSAHDDFRMLTSRQFAEIMHRHKLTTLGSNDREVRSANFAVLRYSTIPAILLELGFMSNPAEFARIQTPEFQWAAARAIYNTLLESFLWIPYR